MVSEVRSGPTPPLRFIGQGDVEASYGIALDEAFAEAACGEVPDDVQQRVSVLGNTLATGRPG